MRPYLKSIAAVVGAAVVTVHQLVADGSPWTITRTFMVVLAVLGALTVYVVPNLTAGVGAFAKELVALGTAGVEATIPLLGDGRIVGNEWLVIVIAVMTVAGVPLVGNASLPRAVSRTASVL
jgi:hypothetical protein